MKKQEMITQLEKCFDNIPSYRLNQIEEIINDAISDVCEKDKIKPIIKNFFDTLLINGKTYQSWLKEYNNDTVFTIEAEDLKCIVSVYYDIKVNCFRYDLDKLKYSSENPIVYALLLGQRFPMELESFESLYQVYSLKVLELTYKYKDDIEKNIYRKLSNFDKYLENQSRDSKDKVQSKYDSLAYHYIDPYLEKTIYKLHVSEDSDILKWIE
jgi:hypothetical protein